VFSPGNANIHDVLLGRGMERHGWTCCAWNFEWKPVHLSVESARAIGIAAKPARSGGCYLEFHLSPAVRSE
jgi:hypothetical protein